MHNYAKYAFFKSWIKTTFLCISDDFQHFLFFHLKYFFRDLENFPVCVAARTLNHSSHYLIKGQSVCHLNLVAFLYNCM